MIYLLDFRMKAKGGGVSPGFLKILPKGPSGIPAENKLRGEEAVTFLIHGFNWNREEGARLMGNLADHLKGIKNQALVIVLWPGDHWAGAINYPFEGQDADETAQNMAFYIWDHISKGVPLSFVTHSLGARVSMEAIKRLRQSADYPIKEVCLMAPAIDDFSLAHEEVYIENAQRSKRTAVLSSKKDRVLQLAYPAGDLFQAFMYFGKEKVGLALGYHGPRRKKKGPQIPAQVFDERIPKKNKVGHSDYVPEFKPGQHKPGDGDHKRQLAATKFAKKVLAGETNPTY